LEIRFSVVIPVYNRPDEVSELLQSIEDQNVKPFEVIVVEDGSTQKCDDVVNQFKKSLNIHYWFKENEGPGLTRNFGVEKSSGNWIIFFDSDCTLPRDYFNSVQEAISQFNFDGFGGPDKEHESFTNIQKAISYSMTAFITTGGIRGSKKSMEKFKPRSFNMGIKKEKFLEVNGFRDLRFGEDLDLSFRLEDMQNSLVLISEAYVYHKRRTSFLQFYKQVHNSGIARVVLDKLHPGTLKPLHVLPSVFVIFHFVIIFFAAFEPKLLILLLLISTLVLLDSFHQKKKFMVSFLALIATYVQTFAYGLGLLRALIRDRVMRRPIRFAFGKKFYS